MDADAVTVRVVLASLIGVIHCDGTAASITTGYDVMTKRLKLLTVPVSQPPMPT